MFNKLNKIAGFTVIEVLVSLSIIVVLSIVSLANFHSYKSQGDLSMAAHKLVSDIRQVQGYALSLKEYAPISDCPDGGWGLYAEESGTSYVLFADSDSDDIYNAVNETYNTINLPDGIFMREFLGNGGAMPGGPNTEVHITYEPPDPVIMLCRGTVNCTQDYNDIEIILENSNGDTISVIVNIVGLVDVNN